MQLILSEHLIEAPAPMHAGTPNDPVNDNSGLLIACGNNKFCCSPHADRGTCNCTTDSGTFSLSGGIAQTIIGVAGLQFTQTPTVSPSFVSTTTSAVVHTTPATSAVQPSQSPSAPPVQPKLTSKAKIGLGVGVGVLGALLLFAITYYLFTRMTGRKPGVGLWIRKNPSLDATPQPNKPPINTPYIPERFASPPPGSEISGSSPYDLPPGQSFAQMFYQPQPDGHPYEVTPGMRREDGIGG
ncbi:hypothetical protein FGG08_005677 [Glutinoglossum americanum]|uniref:Uncharacterized protein n=1 Tax=Glutinoglossum americanum TaxID=1670608 RepID=A0A9P8HZW0_9PEZI|nr:hypothetical protein FGG08_005677 [Glutinoglossum americanum]